MGLMDKVKAQATQLAQMTQEAAQGGMAKLDQAQASRRGEMLLRQLGVAVFAERTGRGTPDSQAKIDQLISDITAHEQANGLNLAADTGLPGFMQPGFPQAPANPNPSPVPAAGNFGGGSASTVPDSGPAGFPGPAGTSIPDPGSSVPGPAGPSFPGGPPVFFPAPDTEPDQGA